MNDYRVNIIIPIYNVGDVLEQCLNSLLAQDYKNIRLVLVDDGSTDESPHICDEFAGKDSRVVVIHQSNGGVSSARNSGLDYLFALSEDQRGFYLAFVDPDDWAEPDYLSFLLSLMKTSNADIAQCGHYISYSANREEDKDVLHTKKILNKREAIESICRNGLYDVTLWNKLYKISLFENLRFPNGKNYEDTAGSYLIVNNSNCMIVDMRPKYHYRQRYTSIANGIKWNENKLDFVEAGDNLASWVVRYYPDLASAALEKRVFVRLSTLSQMVNAEYYNRALVHDFRHFIVRNAIKVLRDKKASKRDKAGILAILLGFKFYSFVWKTMYSIKRGR